MKRLPRLNAAIRVLDKSNEIVAEISLTSIIWTGDEMNELITSINELFAIEMGLEVNIIKPHIRNEF